MRYSYDAAGRFSWMEDHIHDLLNEFMEEFGETIGDADELVELVDSCVEKWIASSDDFVDDDEF